MAMVDVDPCTGTTKLRVIGAAGTQTFSPGAAPAGEAVLRAGPQNFNPNTRNMAFFAAGTPQIVTKNGILSGINFTPVWGFIPPEILIFGEEMLPIGNAPASITKISRMILLTQFKDFSQFQYLAQGSGPFVEGVFGSDFARSEIVGPLTPFPIATSDGTSPAPARCASGTVSSKRDTPPSRVERQKRQATTTSTSPTATVTQVQDTLTLISEMDKKGKGQNTYTVVVQSSQTTDPLPAVFMFGTGAEGALAPTPMNSDGGGQFSFMVQIRDTGSALTSITVVSSFGGQITFPV
jgi:hypothetical protein